MYVVNDSLQSRMAQSGFVKWQTDRQTKRVDVDRQDDTKPRKRDRACGYQGEAPRPPSLLRYTTREIFSPLLVPRVFSFQSEKTRKIRRMNEGVVHPREDIAALRSATVFVAKKEAAAVASLVGRVGIFAIVRTIITHHRGISRPSRLPPRR